MKFIIVIFLIVNGAMVASGQTETRKNPQNDGQTSLEGLTEAVLIDGKPALRILSRKSGNIEVRLETRDGEDALVFPATRVKPVFTELFAGGDGKFYFTKTRVSYVPDINREFFFSASHSEIQELELKKTGNRFDAIKFKLKNDKKLFVLRGTVFTNDAELGRFVNFDRKDLRSSMEFLFRAFNDFASTLAEFNRLTSSLRLKDEDAETEEAETVADVNDKYDRFKDITIVSTSRILLRSNKRSIRTYAEYNFKGKTQKKPERVTLYFYASAARPLFREDDLGLNFLVDDKRVPLGQLRLADEEKTKTATIQTVSISLPYETFAQIANGKKVEFQIGTLEYKLTDVHLEAFRKLLTYKIEE